MNEKWSWQTHKCLLLCFVLHMFQIFHDLVTIFKNGSKMKRDSTAYLFAFFILAQTQIVNHFRNLLCERWFPTLPTHWNHLEHLLKIQIPQLHAQRFQFSRLGKGFRKLFLMNTQMILMQPCRILIWESLGQRKEHWQLCTQKEAHIFLKELSI